MEAFTETIDGKLDEILIRLKHVETLLLLGKEFPECEEINAIKSYLSRVKCGETEFISLEEINNEL
jgi:hypothetical protein